MPSITRSLALAALFGCSLFAFSQTAQAQSGIQLLPPTKAFDGASPTPTPCDTGTNAVLIYHGPGTGGKSAINCDTNLTADKTGNLSANTFQPTQVNQPGGSCPINGQMSTESDGAPLFCISGTWVSGLPSQGRLKWNYVRYDWNLQNWSVFSCDHGYSLVEYQIGNSNVAGGNDAFTAEFQCILTSEAGGTGKIDHNF